MASSSITSWQIDRETVETVSDFIFLGSKITADGDCSHEVKRCLLLGRKVMTNLDSILKSRDITLSTKVHLVKAILTISQFDYYYFSSSHVWMWELDYKESWVLKNWCFWTVVLEKTLESPLDCKEIQPVHPKRKQPWIFIGRADVEAELQYFGHLMWRTDSFEMTLMMGKIQGRRRRGWGGWMASLTQWTWVWVNSRNWWWTGRPGVLWSMGSQSQTWLSDWTELNEIIDMGYLEWNTIMWKLLQEFCLHFLAIPRERLPAYIQFPSGLVMFISCRGRCTFHGLLGSLDA